jgi:hypothetical protein
LELAGATTEQEKTELKKEWSELVRCIDLQKHSQEVATQLKEAKEQLKNANNGTITDLTMRQAATNEEVRAALWRRVAKDKKTLETKIKTLAEAGKTYDMSQADKEIMSRYEEMKAESKGDDDELSSISHAGKRGRGLLNCMQFISDQVSGMRALFAQEAEASRYYRGCRLLGFFDNFQTENCYRSIVGQPILQICPAKCIPSDRRGLFLHQISEPSQTAFSSFSQNQCFCHLRLHGVEGSQQQAFIALAP